MRQGRPDSHSPRVRRSGNRGVDNTVGTGVVYATGVERRDDYRCGCLPPRRSYRHYSPSLATS